MAKIIISLLCCTIFFVFSSCSFNALADGLPEKKTTTPETTYTYNPTEAFATENNVQELESDTTNIQTNDEIKTGYYQKHYRVIDPCGNGWLIDSTLDVTSVEDNLFLFDKKIIEEDRRSFISSQKMIIDALQSNGITIEGISFFVLRDIESRTVSENNAVYIDISKCYSDLQINLSLQSVLGEYTNYGYLYALSSHIASQLKWCDNTSATLVTDVFKETSPLINLLYPSFTNDYSTEEQINAAKALSVHILKNMNTPYSGETEFLKALSIYAESNELRLYDTNCSFAYGGGSCPLKIKTDYMEIYLDSDYGGSCRLTEQSIADDPFFNFSAMLDFLSYLDRELATVREKFGFDDATLIPVYITNLNDSMAGGNPVAGKFIPAGDNTHIKAENIYTLLHEYVHYIEYRIDDNKNDTVNWCSESLACYFGNSVAYLDRLATANSGDESSLKIDDLTRIIGKHYENPLDEIRFQNIMNAYEENHRYSLISLYNGRLSFGDFFVSTYGEKAFIKCMLSPESTKDTVGVTLEEAVAEWCVWLEQFKLLD